MTDLDSELKHLFTFPSADLPNLKFIDLFLDKMGVEDILPRLLEKFPSWKRFPQKEKYSGPNLLG
jgi:hypothetical protein